MSVTISDVAKRAAVSIGTVSRVLNGRDRVSPNTRDRVLRAVQELDYQRNIFARGLATQKTYLLGLIIPQVRDPFFYEIVRGVEEATTAAGYSLLIVSQPSNTSDRHYLRSFRRSYVDAMILGYVDAMILAALPALPYELKQITSRGLPVTLIQTAVNSDIPTFVADNYSGTWVPKICLYLWLR